MAAYSYGGIVTHLGFGGLALALLTTTGLAFRAIKGRQVATHREWMIRSYGVVFAAVTLRIVAWLCWVPNLILAELMVRATRPTAAAGLPAFESR